MLWGVEQTRGKANPLKSRRTTCAVGRWSPLQFTPHKAGNGRFPLPAATAIARSARLRPRADGWPTAKRSCCPSRTFTSSIRCRASCATSPTRTSASGPADAVTWTNAPARRQRREDHSAVREDTKGYDSDTSGIDAHSSPRDRQRRAQSLGDNAWSSLRAAPKLPSW